MLDFLKISVRSPKRGVTEIYPKFVIKRSEDLMIRGGDFYAIWVEDSGLWSTDEQDAIRLIDRELYKFYEDNKSKYEGTVTIMCMWDSDSGSIDRWHKYCQKQLRDNFSILDEKLIFSNTDVNKKDYATKKLPYPLEQGSIDAWDRLIGTLYSKEERHKIEWAIGSVVSGASIELQKFMVLYGEAGAGKSTILNVIQQLFSGYSCVFEAKTLGLNNAQFALESFKNNPLVAVDHDADLSKIEDNTRLNMLVSHELMTVNEKFKSKYETRFKCFLFIGSNKPVKITDAKSGLTRRLIDVSPSGNKLDYNEYQSVVNKVDFELGAIAYHCKEIFSKDPNYYNNYIPTAMLGATNDFYNYILDYYSVFVKEDGVTLKSAWEMYKNYCEEARVPYPLSRRNFKEELRNYFRSYDERFTMSDGSRVRSYYSGFRTEKFYDQVADKKEETPDIPLIQFDSTESIFDKECADYLAQYATDNGTPINKWDKVTSKLSELDTTKLHYVKVPENHIVIDFDIKNEQGEKDLKLNIEEASKWPPTYAELSKSGCGVHLHYIYSGDVTQLSRIYDENIEVKVFTGKSSLRRKLAKCNNLPIASISSGLPLKGDKKVINFEAIKSEKGLRTLIKRHLAKEIMGATKPSIDMIYKILEEAYNGTLSYDISDMKNEVIAFAASSTNQADYCLKLVTKMQFKSEDPSVPDIDEEAAIIFYDVEVFPNLLVVNWKRQGEEHPVVRMINPKPTDIEGLLKYNLVGFNCRRYDNHILYARLMGYTEEQLFELSQKIIGAKKNAGNSVFFGEAYNLSYTDIYDYASKKQTLKKWEIELGIHHQELGLPWDKPVPKDQWDKVAEYCDNDVLATEAVFNATKADFMARQIQVDLVKSMHNMDNVSVNDTTNALSTKIIFGKNRKPQDQFNYRDLSKPVGSDEYEEYKQKFGTDYNFRVFDDNGLPLYRDYIPGEELPQGYSILPFFKDYKYDYGTSIFMDEEIGEGGRVYAEPGMYSNVWDGDVSSMHPHSVIYECLFGPEFTKRFKEIVAARVAIKHKDFETAGELLDGALKPYLSEEHASGLAYALKIVINSIYGLTSARFENAFRDKRNIDNIVAKRGALFMTLLKKEVQKRGYTVAHIKTDSIKIPNADQEIIDFITTFGWEYGYSFETEANFDRFCLVNDAVFVAKYKEPIVDKKTNEKIWWTATGTQFAVPYVFKTLFSKKPITFDDMCETKSVKTALYLDMNENLSDDEHNYQFVGKVGQFCPIKEGCGGGLLLREGKDKEGNVKYDAVVGTKGYRWLEAEVVTRLGKEADIDRSYYDKLVNGAIETISKHGDYEWFVSDDKVIEKSKEYVREKFEQFSDIDILDLKDEADNFIEDSRK